MEYFQVFIVFWQLFNLLNIKKLWKCQVTFVPIKLFNNERRNTMSKFWAKVKFKTEKNAEYLIKAFFKDFNPESSIVVRGNEAKLEIIFRQPPMAIIDAISYCKVIELNYGKNLEEYKKDETIQVKEENDSEQENVGEESSEQIKQVNAESEDSEQTEQAKVKSENSEQTEQPKKKRGRPATKKVESTKVVKSEEPINVPELEEIAKKATSFECFVKLVAEWLEMDKRQKFFENLAIVSTEVDEISWKKLEKALKDKGVTYSEWDKIWAGQQVSGKLKENSVTTLPLLNAIVQYKEYSFELMEEYSNEENSTEQATEEITQNIEEKAGEFDKSVIPKPRVKMECMPEIKDFEETLASVDKTHPVEERVRYVLEAMGLSNMSAGEQKQIVEIASTAVRKGRMAFDIIFVEANIPVEQTMAVRMTFSKFVNDFVQKYENSKKVKLLTFLSELQKIIMFDSEIENFSDFTD